MGRFRVTPNLSLQVNSENLLDKNYYVLDEFDHTYFGATIKYSVSFSLSL